MSASEVHASVKRATQSGLLRPDQLRAANRKALTEFLVYGLKYAFPPERGGVSRGVPTAHSASPLREQVANTDDLPLVWPDPEGTVRGETLEPLYRCVPKAARNDPELHALLALVDAIRIGRARERELAIKELKERLG